jgi:uncharacterized protein YhfF
LSDLPPFELGYPRTELRRQLVAAVLSGEKTATAGLGEDHEPLGAEPLLRVGDRFCLHDADERPVAVVEVTEVRVVPAGEIDLAFALEEGEGFASVEDWRIAHERFFERTIADDTPIMVLRFRLAERL